MTMNKVTTIISIGIVVLVGIAVVNYNSIDVEKINDDISSIPPSAGGLKPKDSDTSSTSDSNGLGSSSTSSSSGLKTTKIYKVTTADGVTSFSDVPRGVAKKKTTTTSTASSATETTGSTSTDSTSTDSTSTGSTSTGSTSTGSTSTTETVEAPVVEEVVEAEVIDVVTTAPPESTSSSSTTSSSSSGVMHSKWEAQFAMLPQDQNGWSIVTPASDSRFIYVSSSSGNDSTAKAYNKDTITNPYAPPSNVSAFKTIHAAMKLQRSGYSDWILLKRGDEWTISNSLALKSGRSGDAPLVITSYDSLGERPVIKTGSQSALVSTGGKSYIAIIGIEFYADGRDPDSMNFVGWNNVSKANGFLSAVGVDQPSRSIILENNVFRYFANNIVFTGAAKQTNIVVRRNQVLNSYSNSAHSQGIFTYKTSMLLEENLIDHNGWYKQNYGALNAQEEGQATWFNHNIYLTSPVDTVVTGNLITRSSSIGIKVAASASTSTKINTIEAENLLIENNLFLEGEVAISAGGNQDYANGYRFNDIFIKNNVMLHIGESQPLRRGLAMGVDVNDWASGVVSGNYFLYTDNEALDNIHGIDISGLTKSVLISNNVFRNYGDLQPITTIENESITNVSIENNTVTEGATLSSRHDLRSYFSTSSFGNGVSKVVEKAKQLSKSNWNKSYTASEINLYLKD